MFSHRVGKLNAEITRLQGKLAQTGYARVSPEDVADAGLFTRLFSRDHRKRQAASLLSARIEALTLSRSGLFATAYNALQPGLAESRALLHDSSRFAREPSAPQQGAVALDRGSRDGWTIEQLAALFAKLGYGVERSQTSDGSPILALSKAGWKIGALPGKLTGMTKFGVLHLFLVVQGVKLGLAPVNAWNETAMFARLTVVDGDKLFLATESVLVGGSEENLAYVVWFWETAIDKFRTLLG